MFSTYHTSGFYCASVAKGFISYIILSSITFNIPLSTYRQWFQITYQNVFELLQMDKYLASRCIFLDPRDMLCACILLYQFRIFERRYGSAKFMSYLFGTFLLSTIFELFAIFILHQIDFHIGIMPTGLWGPVFALYIPYFCDIPRVAVTHLWGIPFTGKSVTYIVGLQMMSTSVESLLLAACGVLSGLAYKNDVLMMQSWLRVPRPIGSLADFTIGRILYTPSPPDLHKPMGATLEIQRALYMEQMEQQLMQSRMASFHQQPTQNAFGFFGRGRQRNNADAIPEEQIQFLVGMGFSRERVIEALRLSNNDLGGATSILLNVGQ